MRLIAPDIILLVAGIVLVAGAASGLYSIGGFDTLTDTSSALGLFNITFAPKDQEAKNNPVNFMPSGSTNFDIKDVNITSMKITVQCTDSAPGAAQNPYRIRIEVTAPKGDKQEKPATRCGDPIQIDFAVTPIPQGGAVPGNTKTAAERNVKMDANATKGTGSWTVRYFGARDNPLPGPIGTAQPDPTGTISLTPKIWVTTLTPIAK